MTRTMLDAIIDRLANGQPVTVYVLEDPDHGCRSPHGTVSRYSNGRCRCQLCRAAGTAAHQDWARRRRLAQREQGNSDA